MVHLIYIYLIINSFVAGYVFDDYRFESKFYRLGVFICSILFGGILSLLYTILPLIASILGWLFREIKFQYRFRFTDYWDKILLDDNYSDVYKTREEKLKRANQTARSGSKQVKRHNKLIQNKYGK